MRGTSTTCDVCGRVKGETNHWLVAVSLLDHAGILYQPAELASDPRKSDYTYIDICGHNCAGKHFAAWLADSTRTQQEDVCQQ